MKFTCFHEIRKISHGIWQISVKSANLNLVDFNEIQWISHEIHLKSVRTTDSSEILHFLLFFHMESSGFI